MMCEANDDGNEDAADVTLHCMRCHCLRYSVGTNWNVVEIRDDERDLFGPIGVACYEPGPTVILEKFQWSFNKF